MKRLQLHSPAVVEEVHTIVVRQLQNEELRESRLDGKAQGLLGTAGLSLTVAFTFGGLLLQHPEYLDPLATCFERCPSVVIILYAVALIAGLLSSIQAVRALFVTAAYRNVDEHDVLNRDLLVQADNLYSPETVKAKADADRPYGNDRAKTHYRRYLIVHLWLIWQRHFRVHTLKAARIKAGQWWFLVFLASLILIGTAITYSALYRYIHPS